MDAVGICNIALGLLGPDHRIQALDEETSTADLCALHFTAVRDAVLAEGAWRFAMVRRELAADATAPAFGQAYRFSLPTTVVQVIQARDDVGDLSDWEREGQFVLTDAAGPIFVRSIEQVEDVTLWPPGFVQAVATRLACALCEPLTENRARAADLWQLYQQRLKEALVSDGAQSAPRIGNQGALDTVRGWRL